MQDTHQTETKPAEQRAPDEGVETVFCRRHGQRVAVTFKTSGSLMSARTAVVYCPLQPEEGCDLSCLPPVGGTPFS
jgi:hypothetical protein